MISLRAFSYCVAARPVSPMYAYRIYGLSLASNQPLPLLTLSKNAPPDVILNLCQQWPAEIPSPTEEVWRLSVRREESVQWPVMAWRYNQSGETFWHLRYTLGEIEADYL